MGEIAVPYGKEDAPKGRSGERAEKWRDTANAVYKERKAQGEPEKVSAALARIVASSRTMSAKQKRGRNTARHTLGAGRRTTLLTKLRKRAK